MAGAWGLPPGAACRVPRGVNRLPGCSAAGWLAGAGGRGSGLAAGSPHPGVALLAVLLARSVAAISMTAFASQRSASLRPMAAAASDKQALQTFQDAETLLEISNDVHKLLKVNNDLTEETHKALAKLTPS